MYFFPDKNKILVSEHLWLFSFFFFLLGCRLLTIQKIEFTIPCCDPWYAEMSQLYVYYDTGKLTWFDLVSPWLQHRILPTRTLAILLYIFNNNQWDNQLQTIITTLIHTSIMTGFIWTAKKYLGWPGFFSTLLFGILFFALPVIWFNAIWGFQSQFYFLIGCSFGAIYWLCRERLSLSDVVFGSIFAFASIMTMGSGFLAAFAIFATVSGTIIVKNRIDKLSLVILLLCMVITIIGILLLLEGSLRLQPQNSHTPKLILISILRCLAWPNAISFRLYLLIPLAIFAWAPFFILLIQKFLNCHISNPHLWLIGLGWWIIMQILAISLSRTNLGANPIDRYFDIVAWGLIVNGLCLITLWQTDSLIYQIWYRHLLITITVIWITLTSFGYPQVAANEISSLSAFKYTGVPLNKAFITAAVYNLPLPERSTFPPEPWLNYWTFTENELQVISSDSTWQQRLPVSVRPPLPSNETPDKTELPNDYPPPPRRGLSLSSFQIQTTKMPQHEVRSPLYAPPRMPWVEVFIAGDAGVDSTAVTVTIQDEKGSVLQTLEPRRLRQVWKPCYFPSPNVPFRIVLTHATPDSWGACTAPREVGRLTAWLVVPLDFWITLCLALAALAAGVALWLTLAGKYLTEPAAITQTTSPPVE